MISVETTLKHCLYGGLKAHDAGNHSCRNVHGVIHLSLTNVG